MATITKTTVQDLSTADQKGYQAALDEAKTGLSNKGVPVGSSMTRGEDIVAQGHNQRVQKGDPIAHGEMNCLYNAGRQKTYRDTTLFTTLAPCMMCTGTIIQFKIPRVVVGENETFDGNLQFLADNDVEIVLLDDENAKNLMREFIETYPDVWNEDIAEES